MYICISNDVNDEQTDRRLYISNGMFYKFRAMHVKEYRSEWYAYIYLYKHVLKWTKKNTLLKSNSMTTKSLNTFLCSFKWKHRKNIIESKNWIPFLQKTKNNGTKQGRSSKKI